MVKNTFHTSGSRNEAAALAFILLVVGAACFIVINRVAGTRMGGVSG
jgi:ABC-type Fe3+ transport system permease subunit